MKVIREQINVLRKQMIDKLIDILIKNGKEIDLRDRSHTPFVDTRVGELVTLDRIIYYCQEGMEYIKRDDNITIDCSNEEYNCTLTIEEVEIDYLVDIVEYLEENFS